MTEYLRVAACVPAVEVADTLSNAGYIIDAIAKAADSGAHLVVLPEMCLTAYTCADLFHNRSLLDGAMEALRRLVDECPPQLPLVIAGMPVENGSGLYNCAVAFNHTGVLGFIPKTYLPTYNEFYEKRWFSPATDAPALDVEWAPGRKAPFSCNSLFEVGGVKIGVEICEDLWAPIPPSCRLALSGADVIANLSASDDLIGKYAYLRSLISQQSARCLCGYVYASAGFGESSTDLCFDGKAIVCECGKTLAEADRFSTQPKMAVADIDIAAIRRDRMHLTTFTDCAKKTLDKPASVISSTISPVDHSDLLREVDPLPFVPSDTDRLAERCEEIIHIQSTSLARRLKATHSKSLTVGISGGLDSTLALLVAVRAFDSIGLDRKGIIGVTMPGFGTTGRTYRNALALMQALGVTIREIPIGPAVMQHFADIGHDPEVHDVTYENSQARERTQLLMDVANQTGGFVLGTGDLSELALGWATYNGDHMSMYGVNAGVPKTLVRHLVRYFANTLADESGRAALLDIIDTPISPELIPADAQGNITQKTEDLVGPYELHDFYIYYMLRYGFGPQRIYRLARKAFAGTFTDDEIKKWLRTFFRRFFAQQFKRSCLPDGPKVGSVALSPRGDWRMPSDASAALWLKECDNL